MKQFIITDKLGFEDISPVFAGEQTCESGHKFGPSVRDYYLIHFCISGSGRLWDKFGEHRITAGNLFIIRPGEVTTYRADKHDPWRYCWLAFVGNRAEIFNTGCSVYKYPKEIEEKLIEVMDRADTAPEIYISIVYELIYRLFTEKREEDGTKDKLHKIRKYIKYNYMENIRVSSLSRTFGFERSYLYRIFKQRYGIGVKDYITGVRMENAKKFLLSGYTVNETAHMVGYEDEFNFSKSFKRYYGVSPSTVKE